MKKRRKSRKRPCRICRKWFYPDPRVGERQKTCGGKKCQAKWHAGKCREWNNKNSGYFREIYLSKKLAVANAIQEVADHPPPLSDSKESGPSGRSAAKSSQLPRSLIQEVIGVQSLVIIEYMVQLLLNPFQEETRRELAEMKGEITQLPHGAILRGDGSQRGP